jgi:transposase IS116/IS110/IS902 family protein
VTSTAPSPLRLLARFPSQDKADWLSPTRLENWLRGAGYNNPRNAPALHAHLTAAARGTTGPQAGARAHVTLALVTALTGLREQIRALDEQIAAQLEEHPDAAIFTSLPRAGTVRAARLLAEIGDARGRYPTPQALTCLAGAAPSTKQSGKVKVVSFRWAVDKQLRDAVMDFAGDSHHATTHAAVRPSGSAAGLTCRGRCIACRLDWISECSPWTAPLTCSAFVGEVTVLGPLNVVVLRVVARLQQGPRTRHVRTTDVLYGLEEALAAAGTLGSAASAGGAPRGSAGR